nr:hypothetical protein [Tanacetum cinerariifolium]
QTLQQGQLINSAVGTFLHWQWQNSSSSGNFFWQWEHITGSGKTTLEVGMDRTFNSQHKVVECETEVTKDMMPPTNKESTKDVQPPVVQVENEIPNSEPVVAPVF